MILRQLAVGPYAANCYIVGSEPDGEGIVIDPGDEAHKVIKAVKELKIKVIVATHGHPDHIEGIKKVKEVTGAEVVIHGGDAASLQRKLGVEGLRLLKGGDSIEAGGLRFLVLHTPGHSPGGICLLGEKVVFTGDTLFNRGIGRYDLPGGNLGQLMNSIHTKLLILPDDTVVYPGHGPQSTIGAEKRLNPFLRQ